MRSSAGVLYRNGVSSPLVTRKASDLAADKKVSHRLVLAISAAIAAARRARSAGASFFKVRNPLMAA